MSYTTFSYSGLKTVPSKIGMHDSLEVSVQVENSGRVEGDEVVQLYVQDVLASVTRPVKELKAFRRVSLKPRDRQRVTFVLHPDDLAFTGLRMNRTPEPGMFNIFVGGNSVDVLEGTFELTGSSGVSPEGRKK